MSEHPAPTPPGIGPDRHVEIETKLDVGADFPMPDLPGKPAVRAVGVTAAHPSGTVALAAVYYDTATLDLLRSRLTLRRRSGGGDEGWHLKLPAGGGARTEMRVPLSTGSVGSPDGGAEPVPAELATLVQGAARGRRLRPVARIDTARTVVTLAGGDGRGLVEVADDAVTGERIGSGTGARRWREIEVEEIDPGPDAERARRATVDALLAAGARTATFASKAGRVLGNLPGGSGPDSTSDSGAPGVETALRMFLAKQRDLLIDADIRLRTPDPDAEAAHDARAAARRMRSVLRVFEPLLPDSARGCRRRWRRIARHLQEFGGFVSAVRDLEVVRARWAVADLPGPSFDGIDRRLGDRLATARSALGADLGSKRYFRLLRGLDTLVGARVDGAVDGGTAAGFACVGVGTGVRTGVGNDRVTDVGHVDGDPAGGNKDAAVRHAASLVAAAWSRLDGDADAVLAATDGGPDEAIHRVRKDAKTVRYAADALAGIGDRTGAAMAEFTVHMEQIQTVLGLHQDAVTAGILIESLLREPDLTPGEQASLSHWDAAESDARQDALAQFVESWPQVPAPRW